MDPNKSKLKILWDFDLKEIGQICEVIRSARKLRSKTIADQLGESPAYIHRIEKGASIPSLTTYLNYFQVLQQERLNDKPVRNPLNQEQIEFLELVYVEYLKRNIHERALFLHDFQLTAHENLRPTELNILFSELEKEKRPAYVMDELWFIHAMNGSLLRMFGMDEGSEYLRNWAAWHIIATKFHPESPLRIRHENRGEHFLPTVKEFFEKTSKFLFTIQMRMLIWKIQQLLPKNESEFTGWWSKAVALDLTFPKEAKTRSIYINDELTVSIQTEAKLKSSSKVNFGEGYSGEYSLVVWIPRGTEAKAFFKHLQSFPDSHRIYFAHKFEIKSRNEFHVNKWPQVEKLIDY